MESITQSLFALRDEEYAGFQAKLTPTLDPGLFIGVRVPEIRKLAKTLKNSSDAQRFLQTLPHKYFDENVLHGVLISQIKDFDSAMEETNRFLPYMDNWAVCDITSPSVFKKHRSELIGPIRKWAGSNEVYTVRFGVEMLMSHFLDEAFKPEYLDIPAGIQSDEYYVNMMIAWFFATALAKQWDSAVPYIENRQLAAWTHNKTIQKAIESYRIPEEQKNYLRTLKIK